LLPTLSKMTNYKFLLTSLGLEIIFIWGKNF
jgi:hypothetical protein